MEGNFACFFTVCELFFVYSKICLKKTKNGFQDRLSLNAGQRYCRMLQIEHTAILSTFIKLPFAIKIFVLSIFEWPLKTGFTIFWIQIRNNVLCFTNMISNFRFFIPRKNVHILVCHQEH